LPKAVFLACLNDPFARLGYEFDVPAITAAARDMSAGDEIDSLLGGRCLRRGAETT
jgi:hypothetical protein